MNDISKADEQSRIIKSGIAKRAFNLKRQDREYEKSGYADIDFSK